MDDKSPQTPWRHRLHEVIFEADTPAGKLFDVVLLIAILLSVLVVMCESVDSIRAQHVFDCLASGCRKDRRSVAVLR